MDRKGTSTDTEGINFLWYISNIHILFVIFINFILNAYFHLTENVISSSSADSPTYLHKKKKLCTMQNVNVKDTDKRKVTKEHLLKRKKLHNTYKENDGKILIIFYINLYTLIVKKRS